ncbi:MAG: PilN domain-containing protein [Methylococcaceae bacterium]|nr:PilN domain-containing protein [Methylococcaceae bacterium]
MLKLDTRIELDVEKFFRWWGSGLAVFVPERLRKLLWKKRDRLILTRMRDGLHVGFFDDAGFREWGPFPLDEVGAGQREQLFAQFPALTEAELVLRLAPEQCLVKVVKFPAAAEENLRQVAAFEMDKLTPFKAEQVYFDVKVLEWLMETRQIRIALALVPRGKLDDILDELISCGWRPERVDVGAESDGHDLLPEKFRPRKYRLPKILNMASTLLFLLLSCAVLGLPIVMKRAQVEELQREVKVAGKVAQEVQTLREEAEKMAHETGFLLQKKREEPAMVDMLEELSKVIPDQTSLNGLQYRDRRVIVQGQSPAASSLIERIEASPYFKNTSFVSPVTKDVSNGQERFQIASEVINGRSSEKPEKPAE